MKTVLRRAVAALKSLTRWYLTPTGVLVVVSAIVAIVVSAVTESPVPIFVAAIFLLLIVFPWKMTRSQTSLNRLKQQMNDRAAASEDTARDQSDRLRTLVQNERRNYLSSLETARSEWADVMSAERLMRDAEEQRMIGQYDDALAQIKKLEAELDGLRGSMRDVEENMRDVEEKLPGVEAAVADAAAKATDGIKGELKKNEQKIINRVDGRLRTERSARLLETARLRVGDSTPERMLIILTPQRTGSTLLMDAFRSYPGVGMWPTARYFTMLGAGGRRYPGDLSPDAGTGEVSEVQPGVGGIVPVPPASWDAERSLGSPKIALEKIHPMTVDFDPEQMIERLGYLADEGITVDVVYQLRDPVESIRSFLAYQQRAERWHPDMEPADVIAQYHASYSMMAQLSRRVPGPVVAYPDFRESPMALGAVYEAVFAADHDMAVALAAEVLAATSAASRQAIQKGPFVDADRSGVPDRTQILLGWPDRDSESKHRVEELMAAYQRLAGLAVGRDE